MREAEPFISRLRARLKQPLPAWEAHQLMVPPVRGKQVDIPSDARLAAVLLLLFEEKGEWHLPLMRRQVDGRVHSGQICWPGGLRNGQDPDYSFTALREAEEEIGVDPAQVTLLGDLSEVYIPPSRSLVYPKLGVFPRRPAYRLDPLEVDEVMELRLADLWQRNLTETRRVEVKPGSFITTRGYALREDRFVWGATAMMLAELAMLAEEVLLG